MSNVFDGLIEKAKHTGKRIILTETEDTRVLEAAEKALSSGDFVRVQHPKTYGKNQQPPRIDRKSNAVIFEL